MIHKLSIREGWVTVILTALLVLIAVLSIQRADWADGLGVLTWVMLAGLVVGFLTSKARGIPPSVLHLAGLVIGLVTVVFAMTSYLSDDLGGTRDKLRWLWDRGAEWTTTILNGESAEDLYLFVLFISVLTFVMAYLTIWFVLRARWIWAAIFFPGAVLLLNLGYSLRVPTGLLVLFVFVSLLLLMRFTLLQRELTWRRVRVEYPRGLMWRGLWVAGYLAIAVIIFGWALPVSARSNTLYDYWREVDGPWRSVVAQVNDWFPSLRGPGGGGIGGFAAFEDSFDLGGPLQLSDDPVLTLDGPGGGAYIQAHSYDIYTGHGWESSITTVEQQEESDSENSQATIVPQYELQPGESVPLDPRFQQERERKSYEITIDKPRGSIIFTPGAFASTNLGANLVISWHDVEETVDVQTVTQDQVPEAVWPLIETLKSVDLTPPPPPATPTPSEDASATPAPSPTPAPPDLSKLPPEVFQQIQQLQARSIDASYEIDPATYKVSSMSYSGRFPILHDIEAVYSREGISEGETYSVDVMRSDATSDALRAAGDQYPAQVTERYLQLPDTVTDRTRELAVEITANAETPYDKAKAIEQYLRETITYSEDIGFPPSNVDVVDYVLFQSQEGYCEYYASAFVVLARSLDIPTRMVTGLFPSDEQTNGGILYRELNAHAWPQVYFPGYGWIGFEPTAAREEISREPVQSSTNDDPGVGSRGLGEGRTGGALGGPNEQFLEENLNLPSQGTGVVIETEDELSLTDLLIRIVPLMIILLILVAIYFWRRGMRGLSPANQMYTKLARGASWGGVDPQEAMTPHEYATHLSKRISGSRQPVTYLTDLYVRENYSQHETTQSEVLRARQAWIRLRGILLRHGLARLFFWRDHRREDDSDEW